MDGRGELWHTSDVDLPEADPESVRLAKQGYSLAEIIAMTGEDKATIIAELATIPGGLTPLQLVRLQHSQLDRAYGSETSLPHAQAGIQLLQAHMPEVYGRQAAAGDVRITVRVDRERALGYVAEGEIIEASPQAIARDDPRP